MDAEGSEEAYTPLEEGETPEPKKKRKTEVYQLLPSSSTIGLDPERIEELQAAFEILQTVMKISKIEAFLLKPNSDLYGMTNYYNIIKQPMWLNEVHRKLMDREYNGINEVVADLKLMLENCYRYWGPSHKVTKKGLHIEHKLEQKLEELPTALKNKCLKKEETVEIVYKTEKSDDCVETIATIEEPPVNELPKIIEPEVQVKELNSYTTYKGFQSKILNKVLSVEQDENSLEENLEEQNKQELVMIDWERKHLVDESTEDLIKHMPELAGIGQFLRLTAAVLNIEDITQYETERMLLMPRESTTLATLMTSMLSPAFLRSNLDVTPIMPYEVWTSKLKKKVEDWLKVYYKTDPFEAFNSTGIEPYFWDVISLMNPLEEKRFHDISFYERVWIVKSLCDNLLHTNKTIQDVFVDETKANEFRPIEFGRGLPRSNYFGLEFLPEIRVYRYSKVMVKMWSRWTKSEVGLIRLLKSNLVPKWNEEEKRIEFLPNGSYFSVEADSIDSLTSLIEALRIKGFEKLTKNLTIYLNRAKKHKYRLEGLEALYSQWHDYQKRAPEYFTNLLNLWLATENRFSYCPEKGDEDCPVLGKRRSARANLFFNGIAKSSEESESEYFEESDVSDWEQEASLKRNRKKKGAINKRRKSKSSANEEFPLIGSDDVPLIPKDIINQVNLANLGAPAKADNVNNISLTPIKPVIIGKISVKPTIELKKEPDDIICISSEDEESPSAPPPASVPKVVVQPEPSSLPPTPSPTKIITPSKIITPTNTPTKLGSSVVLFKVNPATSTSPQLEPVRMPQPIIETVPQVVMPKPIQEIVRTPRKRPVPMPIQEPPPPTMSKTPLRTPPRQPNWIQGSPSPRKAPVPIPIQRQRTPPAPRPMVSPIAGGMRPITNIRSPGNALIAQKNLFSSTPTSAAPSVPSLEGILQIGLKDDGSYGYHVRLPDGGVINMSREDIEILRQKNNGSIPTIVKVPLVRQNNRVSF